MIEKYNFHWREGFFYGFPKKRNIFEDLAKETKTRQIISLMGLRRTGKTTLLKQLADHLIREEKVKREHILFYSFDEEQPRIEEIIHEYETMLGRDILGLKEKVYVFLDEIQKLDNWQNQIKYYYDSYPNIKFFISGSSSLFIKRRAQESLAGRIYEFILKPLDFREFLVFRNKGELIRKDRLLGESLKKEFSAYQKRQFIDIINESEERSGQYLRTMVEKIIYQDVPKVFPIENEELLFKILKIVASNPGMLSDYESLSRELGTNRITLSNYIFYLEESFLVKKLYNFSRNALTSEKKMKRLYLSCTSFFSFLNNEVDEAKLMENLIVASTGARFFWRTPQKHEVDIVLEENGRILPIEVKYRESISRKDLKSLLKFCLKFNVQEAIAITKDKSGMESFEQKNKKIKVLFIPAYKFMLERGRSYVHP